MATTPGGSSWFGGLFNSEPEPSPPPRPPLYPAAHGTRTTRSSPGPTRPVSVEKGLHHAGSGNRSQRSANLHHGASSPGLSSMGPNSTADGFPGAAQLASVGEISGHLHKLGSRVPTWKRRFFVLRPATYLYYYLSSGDEEPAGCINLDLYNECDDVGDEEFADPTSQTSHNAQAPLQIYLQGAPRTAPLHSSRSEGDNGTDDIGSRNNNGGTYEGHGESSHDYDAGRGMALAPPFTPRRGEYARGSVSDDGTATSARSSEATSRTAPAVPPPSSSSSSSSPPPPPRPQGALPPLPDSTAQARGGYGKRGYHSAKGWVAPRHAAALERQRAAVTVGEHLQGHVQKNHDTSYLHGQKKTQKIDNRPGARVLRLRRPDTGQELVLVAKSEEERNAWRSALGPNNSRQGLKAQVERLESERLDMQRVILRLEGELKEARDDARSATIGLQDEQRFYRRLLSELRVDLGLGLEAMACHPSGRFGDAAARTAAAKADKARSRARSGSGADSSVASAPHQIEVEVEEGAELVVKHAHEENNGGGLGELYEQLFKPMPNTAPPPLLGSDQVIAGGGPRQFHSNSTGSDAHTSVDGRSEQSGSSSSSSFSGKRPVSPRELPPMLGQQQQEQRQGSFVDRLLCAPGENPEDDDDDDGTTSRGSSSLDCSLRSHSSPHGSGVSWLPPGWASRADAQRLSMAARADATAACGALLAAARQADASLGAARFDARATAAENRDLRAKLSRVAKHAKMLEEKQRASASARQEQAQVLQRTMNERRALGRTCRRLQREAHAARQAAASAATAAHEAAAKAAAASAQLALGHAFTDNNNGNSDNDGADGSSTPADIAAAAAVASATASAAAAAAVAAASEETPSCVQEKHERSERNEGAKRVERVNTAPSLRLLRTLQAAFSPSSTPPETDGKISPQPPPMSLGPAAADAAPESATIRPRPRLLKLVGSYGNGFHGSNCKSSGSAVAPFAYDPRAFRQELRAAIGRAVDVARPDCSPEPAYRSISVGSSGNRSTSSTSIGRSGSSRADPSSLAAYTVGGGLKPMENEIITPWSSSHASSRAGPSRESTQGTTLLPISDAAADSVPLPQECSSSNPSHGAMDWLFKPHQSDQACNSAVAAAPSSASTTSAQYAVGTTSSSSSSSSSSSTSSATSTSKAGSAAALLSSTALTPTAPESNDDKGLLGSILGTFGFASPSKDHSSAEPSRRACVTSMSSNKHNTDKNPLNADDGSSEEGAVREFGRFAYRVVYRGGVGVRPLPDVRLPVSAVSAIVPCGAAFVALERRIEGSLVYVRLGGWQPPSSACSAFNGNNEAGVSNSSSSGLSSGSMNSIYDSELGPWINNAWGDSSTVGWVFEVSSTGQRVLEPGVWLQEVTERVQVSSPGEEDAAEASLASLSPAEMTVAVATEAGGINAAAAVRNGGRARRRGRFRGESDTDGHTDGSEEEVLAAATAEGPGTALATAAAATTGSGEGENMEVTGDGESSNSIAEEHEAGNIDSNGWPVTSWEVFFFAKKVGIQFKGQKCKPSVKVVPTSDAASAATSAHFTSPPAVEPVVASDGVPTEAVPSTHRVIVAKLADCVVVGSNAYGAAQRMPLPGDALVALNGNDLRGLSWKQVASRLNQANDRPLRLRFDSAPPLT